MKIFLICPVRSVSPETTKQIRAYVEFLESAGDEVHWPPRDTPQDDPIGMKICRTNATAIFAADEVHVWYDQASQGSAFDLGMTFMLLEVLGYKKGVVIANPWAVESTNHKSFPNVLRALAEAHS